MFSNPSITTFTGTYSDNIWRLKEELRAADAVLIGAGAGLSVSAGFTYDGERFQQYFADFAVRYGFGDMYSGGFYPYATPEERWAYWSRYIFINRYVDPPKPVYQELLKLVADKDYFVLTTNVDYCFQKAGFDKSRLFYTQGDFGLFQCSVPCCQETWDKKRFLEKGVQVRISLTGIQILRRHTKKKVRGMTTKVVSRTFLHGIQQPLQLIIRQSVAQNFHL